MLTDRFVAVPVGNLFFGHCFCLVFFWLLNKLNYNCLFPEAEYFADQKNCFNQFLMLLYFSVIYLSLFLSTSLGFYVPEMYTNRIIGVDSGKSFNVSAGAGTVVISFQLLQEQEQDPE